MVDLKKVISITGKNNTSGNSAAPVIQAHDLAVGYQKEIVVPDINFNLQKGEAAALIGTNGSGKSTLLKTIVNLIPAMSGYLKVFDMPPGENPHRIAYLGQFHSSGFILPLCTIDIVRMGRFTSHGLLGKMTRKDEDIIRNSMERMRITHLANMPLRLLSGGQKQRAYIAQVLAHQADLLVMDEPTSGLDAGGKELYLKAVNEELCRGASVVIATHDIHEEAAICDKVILLAHKVIASGKPQEVITSENLLQTFGIIVNDRSHLRVIETRKCLGPDDNSPHKH
jgi:ABC-type Mn2+/Zn2+ transport system ATPase subunit